METPMVIPRLIRSSAQMLQATGDPDAQITKGLDSLRAIAFGDGDSQVSIDQGEWKEEWWNELQSAKFPKTDVRGLLPVNSLAFIDY